MAIWSQSEKPGLSPELLNPTDPVHRDVIRAIQRKYDREGVDQDGAIIVAEDDPELFHKIRQQVMPPKEYDASIGGQ
jgi:hypothetical protein